MNILKETIQWSIIISLFISSYATAQNLTNEEMKVVKSVEKNNNEAIDFLKQVVNINSGTMNHPGVKKVGMVFKNALEGIGFETQWIDMTEVNRSGHLFARTKNQTVKGKKLLLIGHLDVVFEEDS